MAYLVASFIDKSGEKSVAAFEIADQAGATTIGAVETIADSLETALEGISLLTLESIYFRQSMITEDPAAPASEWANRENAARVFFTDDTAGRKGYVSVPGPDLANVARNAGTDLFDLADTEMAALVTWMETNTRIGANSVDVNKAVYVGRNN